MLFKVTAYESFGKGMLKLYITLKISALTEPKKSSLDTAGRNELTFSIMPNIITVNSDYDEHQWGIEQVYAITGVRCKGTHL